MNTVVSYIRHPIGVLQYDTTAAESAAGVTPTSPQYLPGNVFRYMTDAQVADVQARTLTLDVTAAFTSAVAVAVAQTGGRIFAPAGAYLINGGAAQPDGFKNGILIPYGTSNYSPDEIISIEGEAGATAFYCGSGDMILLRCSRNGFLGRNFSLNANEKSNVWLRGIVPEDMTQTTQQVSQSFTNWENVDQFGAYTEGTVFMPGPQVGGADSGCFLHNFIGGVSRAVAATFGKRSFWSRENVDWATHPNRLTRTTFVSHRINYGNTGYQLDVGSEIDFFNCSEETINNGASPNASPTARYVGDDVSGHIRYFGGYSEGCTLSTRTPTGNKVKSYGYSFNSGGDVNEWNARASTYDDDLLNPVVTPILSSSGGGAQGASTSTGYVYRQGKYVFVNVNVSAAKGTLAAGSLSLTGVLPLAGRTAVGSQWLPVTSFSSLTTADPDDTTISAYIAPGGFTLNLRKSRVDGAADTDITVAEFGATIAFSIQGVYLAE